MTLTIRYSNYNNTDGSNMGDILKMTKKETDQLQKLLKNVTYYDITLFDAFAIIYHYDDEQDDMQDVVKFYKNKLKDYTISTTTITKDSVFDKKKKKK